MNNKLWHFGDSFSCWYNHERIDKTSKKGFSEYIADFYNYSFIHFGREGYSNEQIFELLLNNFYKFKPGDFILINWSFFERTFFISENLNYCSTNLLISNHYKKHKELVPYNQDYLENYIISSKKDYCLIESLGFFNTIIIPFIQGLENMGVNVISSFNANNVDCKKNYKSKNKYIIYDDDRCWIDYDLLINNRIDFIRWGDSNQNDYLDFIHNKSFYAEGEDVHYKFGIQSELGKEYIKKIESQFKNKIKKGPKLI